MSTNVFSAVRYGAVVVAGLLAVTLLLSTAEPAIGAPPPMANYIVTLEPGVGDIDRAAAQLARAHGGDVGFVYRNALLGFSISLPPQAALALANNPLVERVEPDGEVTIVDTQSPPPSWGLDRIDQRILPLDNSYNYDANGTGVTAYIIDTGILKTHADFGGRAIDGWDFVSNDGDASDCNGHGTHVAGTVGGSSYGVAKDVTLVAVRVLNCRGSGSWSGVIAGIDWVTGHHTTGAAVANLSLGGGANSSVDTAVRDSVADGVTYVVASGNNNADACNYSPARTPEALTVGATASNDTEASFSNYGTCVDLLAPGVNITSAWKDGGSKTISGTSMASPHVAGAAALYLGANTAASPQAVATAIEADATAGTITLKAASASAGTANLLLHVVASGSNTPPPTSTTGSIAGVVTATTGGVIAGASVSTSTGQTAVTDGAGAYTIPDVPAGSVEVTAMAAGHASSTMAAPVIGGQTTTLNVTLTPLTTSGASTSASLSCGWEGGRMGNNHLIVTASLTDNSDSSPVSGASVTVEIARDGVTSTWTGTTGTNGTVAFKVTNASSGTYVTTVTGVTASPPWDSAVTEATCDKP